MTSLTTDSMELVSGPLFLHKKLDLGQRCIFLLFGVFLGVWLYVELHHVWRLVRRQRLRAASGTASNSLGGFLPDAASPTSNLLSAAPASAQAQGAAAAPATLAAALADARAGELIGSAPPSSADASRAHWRYVFRCVVVLLVVQLYGFVSEHTPLWTRGTKEYTRDSFIFLSLLFAVAAIATLRKGHTDQVLHRDQTEEWKGWMQFLFLLYHYQHAEEVYNLIRVFVSCYVWMTGFGNFSFFYMRRDFGLVRFAKMLFRLTFLVAITMLVQGNNLILYYIVPLHTFYFFVVYATMRLMPSWNHQRRLVRTKVLLLAAVCFIVWDLFVPSFYALFAPFQPFIADRRHVNVLHEWHFRTYLDHYSCVFGIIFALNFPYYSAWLAKLEEGSSSLTRCAVKGAVGVTLMVATGVWFKEVYLLPKFAYNGAHPYWFWVPLTAYIFVRNISPSLRFRYSGLLAFLGQITLETYINQHHIFLSSNAKTLLVLLPDSMWPAYRGSNMVLVTLLFVAMSYACFQVTVTLRDVLLPNHERGVVRNIAIAMLLSLPLILVGNFLGEIHVLWILLLSALLGVLLSVAFEHFQIAQRLHSFFV